MASFDRLSSWKITPPICICRLVSSPNPPGSHYVRLTPAALVCELCISQCDLELKSMVTL